MSTPDAFEALSAAIDNTPLVDNHCHNLLKPAHRSKVRLVSIVSEAGGEALQDSRTSLAHIRGTRILAEVLDCEQTWDAVETAVEQKWEKGKNDAWVKRCYRGIETLLLDDGFGGGDEIQPYSWHSTFVKSKCKRIVRIETLAAELFSQKMSIQSTKPSDILFRDFQMAFEAEIERLLDDQDVVGFKSVICYRGGLDIPGSIVGLLERAKISFTAIIALHGKGVNPFKHPDQLPLNHFLVHSVARALSTNDIRHKPIQFHTGLGDTDITLTKSSPAHLQPFINRYPTVPMVLLHSSYPWTREAGYLATMYPNVYADIGEVFPFLNQDGQEGILRQILELTPWSKVLMSTDGHSHPEMYLIALSQIRSVMKTVIGDHLTKNQLHVHQAVRLVQDILYNNSNKLYDLGLDTLPPLYQPSLDLAIRERKKDKDLVEKLKELDCKWLRVYWQDYTSQSRCRLIPMKRVLDLLQRGQGLDITLCYAALGLLQIDVAIPGVSSSGMYNIAIDLRSAEKGPAPGHASVFSEMRNADGSEVSLCPKTLLRQSIDRAKSHGLEFIMGFELEFVIMERNPDLKSPEKLLTLRADGHAWAISRVFADIGREGSFNSAIDEILDALTDAGIDIEMLHPENAPGQYEIVLPPKPPMDACESLLRTRHIVEAIAARHGFRMTLHPKPFPVKCGTASHMHMSISSEGGDKEEVYESFYAGILKHYSALIAFTYSNPTSYERMVDSAWAGGRYVTWGTQNKEAPLRKCKDSHWEIKTIDGLANPYFVVAAVLSAGTDGYVKREKLTWADCHSDPAKLGEDERRKLGITTMFPKDLKEALEALDSDMELGELLGREFIQRYIGVKTAEIALLETIIDDDDRRQWIMERY